MIFVASIVVVAICRRDLRRGIITVALAGAAWGPISEFWFFRDYWHPESAIGNPILEDIIYGAGISAAASCVYKFLARQTDVSPSKCKTHYRETGAMIILYIAAMIILEMALGINSILVAIGVYVTAASYIIVRRHDLFAASVCTAIVMGLIAVCGYGLGLNFLVHEPSTLSHIWLLYKKPLGMTFLGYVPVTEVVWYTTWGSLLGILYEFATGKCLMRLRGASGREQGTRQQCVDSSRTYAGNAVRQPKPEHLERPAIGPHQG